MTEQSFPCQELNSLMRVEIVDVDALCTLRAVANKNQKPTAIANKQIGRMHKALAFYAKI